MHSDFDPCDLGGKIQYFELQFYFYKIIMIIKAEMFLLVLK